MVFVVVLVMQLCFVPYIASMEEQVKQDIGSKSIQESGRRLYGQPEFKSEGQDAKSHLLAYVKYLYEKQGIVLLDELPREMGHVVTGDTGVEGECLRKQKPKLFKLIKSKASLYEIKNEIDKGADVNAIYNYSTPLCTAVEIGDTKLVKFLISCGAEINMHAGGDKRTPIVSAIRTHNYSMVLLLISLKAEINTTYYGYASLYEAIAQYEWRCTHKNENAKSESFGIIQLLLKSGATIEWPKQLNAYQNSEKARFVDITKKAQSALEAAQK